MTKTQLERRRKRLLQQADRLARKARRATSRSSKRRYQRAATALYDEVWCVWHLQVDAIWLSAQQQ